MSQPSRDCWETLIAEFVIAETAAGRSPRTIRLRTLALRRMARHLDVAPELVQRTDLLTYLADPTWAPETRKSVRTTMRTFFAWAVDAGHLDESPAARLPAIRVPQGIPRPAPEDVLAAALPLADERTALMMRLAAYAGLRASEIAAVHSDDLAREPYGMSLRVKGKGGKTRVVPLLEDLAVRLRVLAETVPGWVFPSPWSGTGHLTGGVVTRLVSEALPDGWTCHTLRHRMATRAYAGTRDLLAVGAVLGHSRPETTQRYVRLPDDALFAAVRAAA